jgi:hypothetical protein
LIAPYRALRPYLVYRELEGEMLAIDVPPTQECLHCSPEGRLGLGDLVPMWRPNRTAGSELPMVISELEDTAHVEVVEE